MSVWFTESFRGQALWDFRRNTMLTSEEWMLFSRKSDIWFDGGTLKETGVFEAVHYPTGTPEEMLSSSQAKMFQKIFNPVRRVGKNGHVSRLLVKTATQFYCGLNSVYKVFTALHKMAKYSMNSKATSRANWVKNFIIQSLISTAYSSRTQPQVMEAVTERVAWTHVTASEKWLNFAAAVRNLVTIRWHGAAMKAATGRTKPVNLIDLGRLDLPDNWVVYTDGWMTYLQLETMDDTEWFAMTTVDLDRLQQMCVSMAMLELHHATYGMTAGNKLAYDAYTSLRQTIERLLIDALLAADAKTSQSLCRDMKKAFGAYLSYAAGELSDLGTQELLTEISKQKYDKTFKFNTYMTALQAAPLDLAQDLGRIFKLLPSPDYDIGQSFCDRQMEHLNPNPCVPTGDPDEVSMNEFRQYQRKYMIITLMRINQNKAVGKLKESTAVRPAWYEAYFTQNSIPRGLAWTDDVDLSNTSMYVERNEDSAVSYKDTAASEEDLGEAMDEEPLSPYKRNMLLRYLFDEHCPSQTAARSMLGRSVHVHRVGFKMEAHKTVSRIFFIGNMADRLVQSEMEENVHRIGKDTAGYMIGQNTEHSIKKVMGMVAPVLMPSERLFFLNFDIKKWSPGMRADVQKQTHELFGEVFGRMEFFQAHKINEKSYIVLNKRGYQGVYMNPGANFEGYNGKEMTWMHCTLMGYSVHRYRAKTNHQMSVSLCAYIDDGLATFQDTAENGSRRFLVFVDTVRKTYAALGFVLELSKCYLSDCLAVYLNEIYYQGRHVTYGLRAVMRIGTSIPEATDTIMDELGARAAGCQGAMKSGMDLIAAYTVFLWASAQILLKHNTSKKMDAKAAVLFFYTPKVFHGLQQPNLIAMSSNLSSDGLAESISTIQLMSKIYPPYKESVLKLFRLPVTMKSDESMLIAPRTVKPVGTAIVESRLKRAVLRRLLKVQLAPRARRLISLGRAFDISAMAKAVITPNTRLVESLVTDIKEATPYAIVMALVNKFESARTIQQLIGMGAVKSIARQNRKDVPLVMAAFVAAVRAM